MCNVIIVLDIDVFFPRLISVGSVERTGRAFRH
jgi:hypothetical protein